MLSRAEFALFPASIMLWGVESAALGEPPEANKEEFLGAAQTERPSRQTLLLQLIHDANVAGQRSSKQETNDAIPKGADCEPYVGQTLTLDTFAAVAAKLKSIPTEKAEYETTPAFDERVAAARAKIPQKFVIRGMLDSQYLKYDADVHSLKVGEYALNNYLASYSGIFGYGQPLYGKVEYSAAGGNRDVVVYDHEVAAGSYVGGNALGARARVVRSIRITQALFESKSSIYDERLFVSQSKGSGSEIGNINMTINEAKSLKASGKVAFVAEPKWPYFAQGMHYTNPKFDNPIDIENPTQVIVADIQCGLILTAANRVVAAFATR